MMLLITDYNLRKLSFEVCFNLLRITENDNFLNIPIVNLHVPVFDMVLKITRGSIFLKLCKRIRAGVYYIWLKIKSSAMVVFLLKIQNRPP